MERIRCREELVRVIKSKFCPLLETKAIVKVQVQSKVMSVVSVPPTRNSDHGDTLLKSAIQHPTSMHYA